MRVIICPNCQAELQVGDIEPGTRIECAACDHKFVLLEDKQEEKAEKKTFLGQTTAFIKDELFTLDDPNQPQEEEKPLLLEEEKSNVQADKIKKQNAEDSFVFGFGEVVKSIYHILALLFGLIGAVLLLALLSQERLYEAGYLFAGLLFFALAWLSGYFALCWLLGVYRNVLEIKKSLTNKNNTP
jgi:hypothetical protein